MTTQKRSLASLKAAWVDDQSAQQPQAQQFTNNYYPFWSMNVGQRAVIRFLPDLNEKNPRGFLVEKVVHNLTVNGQQRKVPCLSMYGEDCPICKISQAYYKAKDDINGKKYWKKKQYLGQALIIEDPLPRDAETGETHQGKVRMIALGYQIYNIIKEAFAGDELEGIPYDFHEGYDFILKKTEQGQYASYTVGTKFSNKQRSLTEAELAVVEEESIDLATLLPKNPGEDKVQAMLDAEMNGEEYSDDSNRSAPATKATPKVTAPTPAASKTAPVVDSEDDVEADVEELIAQIRSRNK